MGGRTIVDPKRPHPALLPHRPEHRFQASEGRLSPAHRAATADSRVSSVLPPEKAMAPHSSALAWKIPWTEEPGGLQSMGSLRVGHD